VLENLTEIKTERRGGLRPGAGRPRLGETKVDLWRKIEDRIRYAARTTLTREALQDLVKKDPQRFIERVVMPLILAGKPRQSLRAGVSMEDAEGRKTQFVLDFGDADQGTTAAQVAASLDELQQFADAPPGEPGAT
jgi:hypothetical protein